jgi:hypothetical protein
MNSTWEDYYMTEDDVYNILAAYLRYMKQPTFYMATDDDAVEHLEKEIDIVGLDLTNPRSAY